MLNTIFRFILLLWLTLFSALTFSMEKPIITIGLIDTFSPEFYIRTYSPTLDHLIKSLPQYEFKVVEIDYRHIKEDLTRYQPSFIVAAASTYLSLMEKIGAHQVATKEPKISPDVSHTIASTIVVRADSPVKKLSELSGKVIATADTSSFDGWIIAMGEIAKLGKSPDSFFSKIVETKYSIPDVISLLKIKSADAGILSNCEYERLLKSGIIGQTEFRILNLQPDDGMCIRSTDRFPDVVFSSLPTISSSIIRQVAVTLLTMPNDNLDFQWTVANEFRPTFELMKSLNISPFQNNEPWTIRRFWKLYKTEILLAIAFVLAILFHIITINLLVRKRTAELSLSIKETQSYYRQAQESRQQLMTLERINIVSQLSSMFAHEIKQPITNIGYYVGALRMLLKKQNLSDDKTAKLFNGIEAEIRRSADIVEHVRSYAKKHTKKLEICNLTTIAEKATTVFEELPIKWGKKSEAFVKADPFELEFIISNFIKNALSAVRNERNPTIRISITSSENYWQLNVTDNGPSISDEAFNNLGKVGHSSKPDGLGFGLAIASAIAEANSGHIEFNRASQGGLSVSLLLPKHTGDNNEN